MDNVSFESLSLTAMAKHVNTTTDKSFSRYAYEKFLTDNGYIADIRTITDFGLQNGVNYRTNADGSSRWPVYNESIANLLISSTSAIEEIQKVIDQNKVEKAPSPKKSSKSTPTSYSITGDGVPTPEDLEKFEFPYLRLEDFVVIDTETTGLSNDAEVIEIAVVGLDKTCLYHSTFYPTVDVDKMAGAVNHFSKRKLKGSPLIVDEWQKIVDAIGGKKILCHNAPYDKRLMVQTFKRYNIPFDIGSLFEDAYDSREIAKKWLRTKSFSLNNLAHLVGIEREELHKATDDCVMTVEFLERLEFLIKAKNQNLN